MAVANARNKQHPPPYQAEWLLVDEEGRPGAELLALLTGHPSDDEPVRFADEPGRKAWIHVSGSSMFAPTVCLKRQVPKAPWSLAVRVEPQLSFDARQKCAMAAYWLLLFTLAALFYRWFTLRLWGGDFTAIASLLIVAAGLWGFVKLDPVIQPNQVTYSIDKEAFETLVSNTNNAIATSRLLVC